MTAVADILTANLAQVRERMAVAAQRSGRSPADVRLVAVTKYVSADIARALFAAGCHDLGESRPQELWSKAAALADLPIRWHFIGHLQRNKITRTLPLLSLLHSGDSLRLLEALNAAAPPHRKVPTLLEVNISGDAAKHGFTPTALREALPAIAQMANLEVRGLMGMSGLESTPEQTTQEFANLRQLRDELAGSVPSHITMTELSMGMSEDFEAAIAAGATMVRVGSALFTGLEP